MLIVETLLEITALGAFWKITDTRDHLKPGSRKWKRNFGALKSDAVLNVFMRILKATTYKWLRAGKYAKEKLFLLPNDLVH